jgi:NAD(P)H-dependent flavin oxidoreductase YrpB (nitropropane dioxygenase family)
MIRSGVRVASFALAPSEAIIKKLHDAGLLCIPSVGALRHAEKVAGWGVDAVIVQGGEGGGHTGPVPTSLLLPQVIDAVDIPVIAAGGFFDGRGLVAAMAYGAQGIAMGTRFLLTQESPVPEEIKRMYLDANVTSTVVTSRVDGHPHRMIRTPFVSEIEDDGFARSLVRAARNARAFKEVTGGTWREFVKEGYALRHRQSYGLLQVMTAANAPVLCRTAMVEGRSDIGILSSGQVAGVIDDLPTCAQLIDRTMSGARRVLDGLAVSMLAPQRPGVS